MSADNKELHTDICNPLNEQAWNTNVFQAWVNKFGTPQEAAEKIRKNPQKMLAVICEKFGEVKGKKIANLMGSNGTKAVALALLGAEVTLFDFSEDSRNYALALADKAGVNINYVLNNVVDLPEQELTGDYDIVFCEIGILHYFTVLKPLFTTVYQLLNKDGVFVLRDFHPVSNKLITSKGTTAKIRKHKVTGDYFDTELVESDISFSKYAEEEETMKVYLRKWNLGEIITAVAGTGLVIQSLDEEPNFSCEQFDKGIPKTFTLVAKK